MTDSRPRGADGRYVSQAFHDLRRPVSVTCHKCGTAVSGAIFRGTVPVPTGEFMFGCPLHTDVQMTTCLACIDDVYRCGHRLCAWCGRCVYYRGHPSRYCSDECRQRARNERRRADSELARHRRCVQCGQPFRSSRKDTRYCSARCRVAGHRQRQAQERSKRERGLGLMREYEARVMGGAW